MSRNRLPGDDPQQDEPSAECDRCQGEIYRDIDPSDFGATLCDTCRSELDSERGTDGRRCFYSRSAWLAARKRGLGASEAAAAIGRSPWKTNIQLWEEKTGRREPEDIGGKPAVSYGTRAEGPLRELFTLDFPQYHVEHSPYDMLFQPERPWLFATLDGELSEMGDERPMPMIHRKGALEIKTSAVSRAADWNKWREQVPAYYYTQILHQLLATGFSFAVLKAQLKGLDGDVTTRHYHFEREDVQDDIVWLLKREEAFWDCVEHDRRPALILPEI